MEYNKIGYDKLDSGGEYTLAQIFSKDNKIVIPDLQRDYCWGGIEKDEKNLVRAFVNNIIDKGYNKDKTDLNLGLLYGYAPILGHIQLCDGQQRITTLFLLLGMLNKHSNNTFQDCLISPSEYEDDKEPHLQYAIRETSLYFLSDLVCEFFIKGNKLTVDNISKQPWYFKDYDLDPSIQSMISALKIIEREIKSIDDTKDFGEYLISKLSFMYYDMGNRKNGEETFVVINTTGEPLSTTQNLKPLLISEQKEENKEECSRLWEEWETWFWKYRYGNGKKENDTAESGFKEFFRWITFLNTTDKEEFEDIQKSGKLIFATTIDYKTIDDYFRIVKYLFEESSILKNNLDWLAPHKKGNDQIVLFRLLPVIEYLKRFGLSSEVRNIIRVKTFFKNLARISNVKRTVGTLLFEATQIIKEIPTSDIASILQLEKVTSQILTVEEKRKFELYLNPQNNRVELEDFFWKAEEHEIWKGEITPLIHWAIKNGIFDIKQFRDFNDVFCTLFHDFCDYPKLDVTRRALLTRKLKEYPKIFRGYTNWSFCWEYTDWQTLINENEEEFGRFLQELIGVEDVYEQQSRMIANNPNGRDWDEFVKIPELLKYCSKKNVQWHGVDEGWILLAGEKVSGPHANLKSYRLYLDLKNDRFWNSDIWEIEFYHENNTCAYFDNKQKDIAIDIFYSRGDLYQLQIFRRNNKGENKEEYVKQYLSEIAQKFQLKWNGSRYDNELQSQENIIKTMKQLLANDYN